MTSSQKAWYGVLILVATGALWITSASLFVQGVIITEHILFKADSSAERAYRYGSRHFDATNSDYFDLDLALYFYDAARSIDTFYPGLHHQLARIAFLRGDYYWAMREINFEIDHTSPPDQASYYIRGLIAGYAGDYESSAQDFRRSIEQNPHWASYNDLAWILLASNKAEEARMETEKALALFPENPWLLNAQAIALFELGEKKEARVYAEKAVRAVQSVDKEEWLRSYPGNDPLIASQSVREFKAKVLDNYERIAADK